MKGNSLSNLICHGGVKREHDLTPPEPPYFTKNTHLASAHSFRSEKLYFFPGFIYSQQD